jgi:NADH:ubiquinone oxidoreductase subunit 6 (subunit J)
MASKTFGVLVMGSISLFLFTALTYVALGQSRLGPLWIAIGWAVSVLLTATVLWQAETPRSAWGYFSLFGGLISFVLFLVIVFVPVSASAPYDPGADWLRTVDLTPPMAAKLREAMLSGYFALAVIILGIVLLSAAYVLLRFRGPPAERGP